MEGCMQGKDDFLLRSQSPKKKTFFEWGLSLGTLFAPSNSALFNTFVVINAEVYEAYIPFSQEAGNLLA